MGNPLTCLCMMLQNRQSRILCTADTAKIPKAKSLPTFLQVTLR